MNSGLKIGLIDADGHNFPNLALMKISSYHKSIGDSVGFVNHWDTYDKVYISKVFSYSPNPLLDHVIQAKDVSIGGTGWDDQFIAKQRTLLSEIEHIYPDYTLYPRFDYALGFLTRGCGRKCPWCIVNEKEGDCNKVADIDEFWNGQKEIKLLDPNLLAYRDRETLLKQLIKTKAKIDFTQGLDIRLLCDKETIDLLKKVRVKRVHFAYDEMKHSGIIEACLTNFKRHTNWGRNKVSVYVLTNYNSTFEEDMHRIEFCKSLDFTPYVMIYNKQNLRPGSVYFKLQKWCNNPLFLYTNTFDNFVRTMYK